MKKAKKPTKVTKILRKEIIRLCTEAANPDGTIPTKATLEIGARTNVSRATVQRAWRNHKVTSHVDVPRQLPRVLDEAVRKQGVAAIVENHRVLPETGRHVSTRDGTLTDARDRSARADVFPTTTVARTRGSVVVVFDVNASIVDVINTVTAAWQTARGGV